MNNDPTVTCLMPTCGRTVCIGESIFSFLNQSYPNKKLIILDTHPQDIKTDMPSWSSAISYIKRPSTQFKTLGDKFRFLMNMVDSELFCIWEDDDLWLPDHLERLVSKYKTRPETSSKPLRIGNFNHFIMYGGVEKPISSFDITSNYCWCRYLYENKKLNMDELKEPFDIHFLAQFEPLWEEGGPTYIYRWDNGQCHMSGLYGSKSYEDLYRLFEDSLSQTDISNTVVEIKWRHDYVALAKGKQTK